MTKITNIHNTGTKYKPVIIDLPEFIQHSKINLIYEHNTS